MDLVRDAFVPRVPNYRLFQDIFETPQSATISTDQYVTMQRDRLARMSRKLDEEWQLDIVYGLLRKAIRDRVPRDAIANFAELLEKARLVEQSERESRNTVQEAAAPEKGGGKSQGNRLIKCEYCRNFGPKEHECRKKQRDVAKGQTASTTRSAPRPAKTAAEKKQIHCYGCHRPGVYRDNCPTCSGPNSGVSNEICALTVHSVVPRLSPTVLVFIADLQESAIVDTAACNSVASADLYKHLLATGHPTQKVVVAVTFADGNAKTLYVQAIVKLADHEIRTTFVVLFESDSTRTLLGADFIEDSKLVLDLSSRKYGFNYAPGSWYPFLPSTTPGPGMDKIDAILQEMKMPSLIEPLVDNGARDYQHPTSRITQPAIHDGRGVWNVYQAQGSSDYIMQDAADALMDYEMESSSGYDSPIRIHLATLHLRPVEGALLPEIEKERLNALLDQHVELFAKTGPPTPFAENQIDTGDSTPIFSPPYRLPPGKRQTTQTEIHAMLEAFQALKKQLTSTPVLRTADPTQPFILRTDSSAYTLGTALLQGEAPEECPIEYASRLLTKTERNYSNREREVLANVWTINTFRSCVKETSIVVIIDCRPLPWFIALKPPSDFFNSTKAGRKLERPMKSSKLALRRDGPYIVLQQNDPTSYVLAARDKPADPLGTYHVSQLTPYLESEDAAAKPIHPIKKRGRPRKNLVQ
jgi:hypothetical protein